VKVRASIGRTGVFVLAAAIALLSALPQLRADVTTVSFGLAQQVFNGSVTFAAPVLGDLELRDPAQLGSESLTNGALTAGTSWTATTDFALAADAATYTHSAGGGSLTQASTAAAIPFASAGQNGWFSITYTTSAVTGSTLTCSLTAGVNDFVDVAIPLSTAAGTYTIVVKAQVTAPDNFKLSCNSSAAATITFDTLSLKQINGGDLTVQGNLTVHGTTTGRALTSTTTQSDAVIATYTAITGLSFTPAASTNYLIDCYIIYTSTAATTGINFAWDVPAAVTSIHMTGYTTTTELGANEGFIQRADNVGTPTTASVITTEQVAVLQARLKNGVNATSTALGFTPETADSVSVLAGSTCQYRIYY